ncbi:MAG: sigma-70 family polymerase sigma factor [Microbacteriaceae bacterium]|nr:sigma-70 family polymerase sigma factor [Microbacteriaceae bacterium]
MENETTDEESALDEAQPAITSDESLVLLARAGDKSAFAELWQRHARSGMRVARQFTSSSEADDLVSEAYVRIYQRVLAGGGPDGAFRPYLYTTIRNLAARWGRANHSITVEDIGEFEDVVEGDDPATVALDRTLTVSAFRSLPERWQSVLWYTEVEGMDPHEVAPILGISANGVAALSYRAREGLRKAWLQAHVSDATASGECRWTIGRLGEYARKGMTARERTRVEEHLATCTKCAIINEEVDEVGSHLAFVLIPLILGGAVGGTFLASLSAPSGAVAAEAVASAMPPAFHTLAAASAPAVSTGLAASAVTAPLVGALSVALAVSGGLAVTSIVPREPAAATQVADGVGGPGSAQPAAPLAAVSPSAIPDLLNGPSGQGSQPDPSGQPAAGSLVSGVDSTLNGVAPGLGSTVGGVVSGVGSAVNGTVAGVGSTVDGVVKGVTAPINGLTGLNVGPGAVPDHTAPDGLVGATTALDLSGRGMPGATVSVQAAGVVYATTKVTPQGTWAVHISALPSGVAGIQLKQTLVSLLGIDLVSVPLSVLSNSLGVTLNILGL